MPVRERRRLVELFDSSAERLIPAGIRLNDTVYTTNLTAATPSSDGLVADMELALASMQEVLADAGVSLDGVARVVGYVTSREDRDPIYGPWDTLFPDPADRPAFKVLLAPLPPGVRVRLDMLAFADGRRQRIDIPGVPARDPTVIVDGRLFTSRVHGTDPETGKVPDDRDQEREAAFANIARLLELAGGSVADITQLSVFFRDSEVAAQARRSFEAMFPNPEQRPTLRLLNAVVPGHLSVMLEAMAVIGGGGTPSSALCEVSCQSELTPIPDAFCIGNVLFAPAITGADPATGQLPVGFPAQIRSALVNMRTTVEAAGLSMASIGQVTVHFTDYDHKPALNDAWSDVFPDPADRPPHKYVVAPLVGDQLVQLQVFALRNGVRKVLEIQGLAHGDPMSMGAQLGDLLFTSRLFGTDPATGKSAGDLEAQAHMVFQHAQTLLEQAGAGPEHLNQVLVFANDDRGRTAAIEACNALFPSPAARPAVRFMDAHLPGSSVRIEILATT